MDFVKTLKRRGQRLTAAQLPSKVREVNLIKTVNEKE
ncbi:hypothetical protein predicted by Glimmer/Critica [Limosilactobacillus fermentum]|nr:hypothetical protein predicted by Glimmer/Critica [Limosilactobacillus fermentum]